MGRATAKHLVDKGADVAIFDIDEVGGKAIAAELGEKALYLNIDVSDADAVKTGVKKTIEKFDAILPSR